MNSKTGLKITYFAFLIMFLQPLLDLLSTSFSLNVPFISTIAENRFFSPALWVLAALGYLISFFAEHDIFDLAIGGGFVIHAISILLPSTIFTLIFLAVLFIWAIKIMQKGRISRALPLIVVALMQFAIAFVVPRLDLGYISMLLSYSTFVLQIYYIGVYLSASIYDATAE